MGQLTEEMNADLDRHIRIAELIGDDPNDSEIRLTRTIMEKWIGIKIDPDNLLESLTLFNKTFIEKQKSGADLIKDLKLG